MVDTDATDRWSTPPRLLWLWAGLLLAPAAWAAQLSLGYALAETVCTPGWTWPFHAITACTLAIALAGVYAAWRVRRESSEEDEPASDSRSRGRFMALSGILLSGLFVLAIAAQAIPIVLLDCR